MTDAKGLRELDAAIAHEVFNVSVYRHPAEWGVDNWSQGRPMPALQFPLMLAFGEAPQAVPYYSSDPAAAHTVAARVKQDHDWSIAVHDDGAGYTATVTDVHWSEGPVVRSGATYSEAICQVVLASLGRVHGGS